MIVYFKIFLAKLYLLFFYKWLYFLGAIIILFFYNLFLIDKTLEYSIIENNTNKAKKVLSRSYNNEEEQFIIKKESFNDDMKLFIFVKPNTNINYHFNHLNDYSISYIQNKEKVQFEIDFYGTEDKIDSFIKNLYNSYLNTFGEYDPNYILENNFINSWEFNVSDYSFNDLIYKSILIMNNQKEQKHFEKMLEEIKEEFQKCTEIETIFNIKEEHGRLSFICENP